VDLENQITRGEQDLLNPIGVNCIRAFPGRGIRVWGARTLSSDPAWRYLNIRRYFNYLEESILLGTQWVVFEPNDHALWARIRRNASAFLVNEWRSGALFGRRPEEAFYVKCDEETNPPETVDVGRVVCENGIAPVKPFFMENIHALMPGGPAGGLVTVLKPDTELALVSGEDIGAATARALADPDRFHEVELELASDRLTMTQIAQTLSEVWDVPVVAPSMSVEEALAAGMPMWGAAHEFANARSQPARPEFAQALGIPLTTFADWAREHPWAASR
jgi:hypothetical protein